MLYCVEKVYSWQKLLGCNLYLENYPSIIKQNYHQADFYSNLFKEIKANLLFDISNADIAEKNTGQAKEKWFNLTQNTNHFHIGGYERSVSEPNIFIDTHNNSISHSSLEFAKTIINSRKNITISIERDNNFNRKECIQDVLQVRKLLLGE